MKDQFNVQYFLNLDSILILNYFIVMFLTKVQLFHLFQISDNSFVICVI